MPAPFSRVLNGPPAQPATSIAPAKKSTGALLVIFLLAFMIVSPFLFTEAHHLLELPLLDFWSLLFSLAPLAVCLPLFFLPLLVS
jgi:hypothetical protein